ncbi:MAG: hypothetical protein Q9N02_04030 [Ghiorsea sp.]|nr:hypothetical protein [Ghiorsea sp.]
MYLSVSGVLLLLLIAWHYSIQAAAHNTARDQVTSWLQSMGASAEQVDFRMLRGALTIQNIKATYLGGDLLIQQLFIKGNPASITSDHPLLQQMIISQASYDASALSKDWQGKNITFPPTLARLFYHTKHIQLVQSDISHSLTMPKLIIKQLSVSGSANKRHLMAQGYLGNTSNTWQMNSIIPTQSQQQTGHITSQYQGITSQISWTGFWLSNNLKVHVKQQQKSKSLQLDISQEGTQWNTHFNADTWNILQPTFQTSITGQGDIIKQGEAWLINSPKLRFNNSSLPSLHADITQSTAHNIHINTEKRQINIENLLIQDATFSIDTYSMPNISKAWHINLNNISLIDLHPTLLVQQSPIRFPALNGYAKIARNQLAFDVSGQSDNDQFVRLKSHGDTIRLTAKKVPLRMLRNLLPTPLQEKALTLEGSTQLQLSIKPTQQWQTTGQVHISDMHMASKNQIFKTSTLHLDIQHANLKGVQQASLTAEDWRIQLPLTPRQAWGSSSHLEDWIRIPWQLQNIQLKNGTINIGGEQQPWFEQANLHITHWQTPQAAQLDFQSSFGLSSLNLSMVLQPDAQRMMQWEKLKLSIQHANMFTLLPWLSLSGLPSFNKGQFSINLQANKETDIQGQAELLFSHLQCSTLNAYDDFLLHTTGQTGQNIIQRLSHKHKIAYQLNFHGKPEQDLGQLVGRAILQTTINKLNSAKNPKPHNKKQKVLGSIRIHQNDILSHNERTRLRQMIKQAKRRGWHIELLPDVGTSELTAQIKSQIYQTQALIKQFISQRGIKSQNIYLIAAHNKHHSTSSTASIHIYLVK